MTRPDEPSRGGEAATPAPLDADSTAENPLSPVESMPSRPERGPASDRRREGLVLAGLALVAAGALGAGVLLGGRGSAPAAPARGAADGTDLVAVPPAGGAPDDAGVSTGLVEPGRASLGEPAPDFTLETPDRGRLSLSDFAGRPVVLNFWATWCRPCAVEMPYLQLAHAKYGDAAVYGDGALAVVAVNVAEMSSVVAPFLEERGLTFPVALDLNSAVANQYRVFAYPTTYLIDRTGRVVNVRRGAFANQFDLDQGIGLIMPEIKE